MDTLRGYGGDDVNDLEQRIKEVSAALEDARLRLPAHSLKPKMWEKIEELEEELAKLHLLKQQKGE